MQGGEGKGTSLLKKGDLEGPRGKNLYTPMIPGSGCRPKYPSEENLKPLKAMEEERSMKGRGARGEGERVSICRGP